MSIRKLLLPFLTVLGLVIGSFFLGVNKSNNNIDPITPITFNKTTKTIHFAIVPLVGYIDTDKYSIIKNIFFASHNENLDGILLIIDSNGGEVGPSLSISEAVTHAAKCKPTISFVPGYALSGGYWIAASAPYIIAAPMSLIGSVGFCVSIPKQEKDTAILISDEEFKFSRFDQKGKMMPEHMAFNQELAASCGALFRDQIVKLRPVLTHQSLIDLQAKYFTGDDSLKHKLVDQIGSMKDATAELYRRAGSPNCDFVELLNLEEVVLARFTPQELLAN